MTIGYKPNTKGGVTQVRKVLSGATRAEVAEQIKKALRDQQQGVNIMPERVTVGAHLQRWLTDVVKPSCSYKTHQTYEDLVAKHIEPALGRTVLAKLNDTAGAAVLERTPPNGAEPQNGEAHPGLSALGAKRGGEGLGIDPAQSGQ